MDNINVTPGIGATIAAENISGALIQRVKVSIGNLDVDNGDISATNPMPITAPVALPVTGPMTDAQMRATPVPVSLSPTSVQPVTFWSSSRNAHLDAFKRLRVSQADILFDCKNVYDMNPLTVDNILTGSATATFIQNQSSIQLITTSASGDKVTRRSRQWIKYQPGSSQLAVVSCAFTTPKVNLRQRIGIFDDNNGYGFEVNDTVINAFRRTFTSGSSVTNYYPQSTWNLDTMDGSANANNPSGRLLNFSTTGSLLVFDYQWLSLGRIRWGFDLGDEIVYVHQYQASNVAGVPNSSTPDFPVTWELENVGAVAGVSSIMAICASVHSEGKQELFGVKFSRPSGTTTKSLTVGTSLPILSIRPKALFGGITNRGIVGQFAAWLCVTSASTTATQIQIIYNGVLTGPSWVSQGANSSVEYDISSTVITGGELIDSSMANGTSTTNIDVLTKQLLTLSANASTQDTLTVLLTSIVGTSVVVAGLDWKEFR